MTKNQKIAAGCGGLGCLGLIVLLIAGGVYFSSTSLRRTVLRLQCTAEFEFELNQQLNSNSNTTESNSNSTIRLSSSSSSYPTTRNTGFQAASASGDADLVQKVVKKTGLLRLRVIG